MGLGRGDASGNGTWICDIVGYKLSIEIQLQRTGIKIKIREDVWGAGDAAWAYREINRHNKRSTWLQSHVIQTVSTCGPPAHDDERFSVGHSRTVKTLTDDSRKKVSAFACSSFYKNPY